MKDFTPKCPKYTDDTYVSNNDSIRFKQAPGGILSASDSWKNGIAVPASSNSFSTLVMLAEDGYHYNLLGHVIERRTMTTNAISILKDMDDFLNNLY